MPLRTYENLQSAQRQRTAAESEALSIYCAIDGIALTPTLIYDFQIIFVYSDKKIAYNLETAGQISGAILLGKCNVRWLFLRLKQTWIYFI